MRYIVIFMCLFCQIACTQHQLAQSPDILEPVRRVVLDQSGQPAVNATVIRTTRDVTIVVESGKVREKDLPTVDVATTDANGEYRLKPTTRPVGAVFAFTEQAFASQSLLDGLSMPEQLILKPMATIEGDVKCRDAVFANGQMFSGSMQIHDDRNEEHWGALQWERTFLTDTSGHYTIKFPAGDNGFVGRSISSYWGLNH